MIKLLILLLCFQSSKMTAQDGNIVDEYGEVVDFPTIMQKVFGNDTFDIKVSVSSKEDLAVDDFE